MHNGKKKAVTFSFDDGITQDRRLIKLFDKYGMKCTFNLNSERLATSASLRQCGVTVAHAKVYPEEVADMYAGHEVAAHTLTHPLLTELGDEEVVRQVEQDRLKLSELAGYEVVGFAYPGGGQNHDERVAELVKSRTGVKYARTIISSGNFAAQEDLFRFRPTVHTWDREDTEAAVEAFLKADGAEEPLLYIWGHSYEFDVFDTWGWFEGVLEKLSRRDDVFYGTNRDVLL